MFIGLIRYTFPFRQAPSFPCLRAGALQRAGVKTGIQDKTGFPRIKQGAGSVKPGMTNTEEKSIVLWLLNHWLLSVAWNLAIGNSFCF